MPTIETLRKGLPALLLLLLSPNVFADVNVSGSTDDGPGDKCYNRPFALYFTNSGSEEALDVSYSITGTGGLSLSGVLGNIPPGTIGGANTPYVSFYPGDPGFNASPVVLTISGSNFTTVVIDPFTGLFTVDVLYLCGPPGPGSWEDTSITKTLDTAGPFIVGQEISYTIVATNHSAVTVTNVYVTDSPTNLTITGISNPAGCTTISLIAPCIIPSLDPGASETIIVTATIDAAGDFDNLANSRSSYPFEDDQSNYGERNPDNNRDDEGNGGTALELSSTANVSITKTLDTAAPFTVGQELTFTITVNNAGPLDATDVEVTELPTNMTITSVSSANCAALPCTIASLTDGSSEIITVVATIDAEGSFENSATVASSEPDPDPANNAAPPIINFATAQSTAGIPIPLWSLILMALGALFLVRKKQRV